MRSSTFHRFSSLSTELRLMIWRSAIRPHDIGAIHHLNLHKLDDKVDATFELIKTSGDSYSSKDVFDPAFQTSLARSDQRSAAKWDYSLWAACHESRDVIEAHFNTQSWSKKRKLYGQLRHSLGPDGEVLEKTKKEKEEERRMYRACAKAPVLLSMNDWNLLTRPFSDCFCLNMADWRNTLTLFDIDCNFPFSFTQRAYSQVYNIAVDFDASWSRNLPADFKTLANENSPRGFIARSLQGITAWETEVKFWLIDRARRKPRVWDHDGTMRFFDCEYEYAQIFPTERKRRSYNPSSAAWFIKSLIPIVSDVCKKARAPFQRDEGPMYIENHIYILGRTQRDRRL